MGDGKRSLPPGYCAWILGDTPLGMSFSTRVKKQQLTLHARIITGEFGTSLAERVTRESWEDAWARLVGLKGKGPTPSLPTATEARAMEAHTQAQDILRSMLRAKELRGLAVEKPWDKKYLVQDTEAALHALVEKERKEAGEKWEKLYGAPDPYKDQRGSRAGWRRLHGLQAQPCALLVEDRDGNKECESCKAQPPQGVDEGAWTKVHLLLHCAGGAGVQTSRAKALTDAAARVRKWARMTEVEQAEALLGGEVRREGGLKSRLEVERTVHLLGELKGHAW